MSGLPQPKDLLRICSVYQSCIVLAPGETDRRCPGIVLINTAPLSATAVTPMGRVGEGAGGHGTWTQR